MDSQVRKNAWIIDPTTDLVCITLGWMAFFWVPYFFAEYAETLRFIAVSTFVGHRYITFPLVYFDRAEFNRRPGVYILTPILAFAFVGLCYYFRVDEPEMFTLWYLFTLFHIVRQKYGILRIYSGKAGWGHKRLDAWTTYAWGLAGFFYMLCYQADEGRVMHYLRTLLGAAPPTLLADGLYAAAVLLTGAWLVYELRSPERISLPKLLFFGSVAFMLGACPILSADATAIASAFSHAAEYFALVGVMVKNKARTRTLDAPILSRVAPRVVLHIFLFILYINLLFFGIKALSVMLFQVLAYGSSFMHYIYDGMIWRIRRPRVAQEVGVAA